MDIPTLFEIGKRVAYRIDMNEEEGWCIAGGSVRDALIGAEPKDIDLYALGFPGSHVGPVQTLTLDQIGYDSGIVVQIMHTRHRTAEELIESFDWNICRCALLPDGRVLNPHDVATIIENKLTMRLMNITNPFANLRRGYRFSERYDTPIHISDLMRLFQSCLSQRLGPAVLDKVGYVRPEDARIVDNPWLDAPAFSAEEGQVTHSTTGFTAEFPFPPIPFVEVNIDDIDRSIGDRYEGV